MSNGEIPRFQRQRNAAEPSPGAGKDPVMASGTTLETYSYPWPLFAVLATALLPSVAGADTAMSSLEVVQGFIEQVRSGRHPERAAAFMAPRVLAHQVVSEAPVTIERTPEDYAHHVREFIDTRGPFDLDVLELIAQGPRVYVRWRQTGRHIGEIEGVAPTGRRLVELGSAVYLVKDGRIVEYWVQLDRQGLKAQLLAGDIPR